MARKLYNDENIMAIANAVRNKNGSTDTYKVSELAGVINDIPTGIDTSDATATADNIFLNKTAYVNGEKITGTMPNNGQLSYEVNDSEQTIPLGYTSGGTISAVDITKLNDYKNCLRLSEEILENANLYTELNYIESTGTQYIDTGVIFSESGGIAIIDFQYTTSTMDIYICGTNQQFEAGKSDRVAFYTGSGFTYSQSTDQYARTIATGNNTGSNPNSIFLCARNWSGLYRPASIKLYSAKFYNKENTLVRDLIPVIRKSDNVICMYDKVSEIFLTNEGTGTFISGGVK